MRTLYHFCDTSALPESNHKEMSNECELIRSTNNWPVIFKSIKIMKFKQDFQLYPFAIKNIIGITDDIIGVWKLEGSNLCEFPDFDGYIVVK